MIKRVTLLKGVGVVKFDFIKAFSNPLFSGVTRL